MKRTEYPKKHGKMGKRKHDSINESTLNKRQLSATSDNEQDDISYEWDEDEGKINFIIVARLSESLRANGNINLSLK